MFSFFLILFSLIVLFIPDFFYVEFHILKMYRMITGVLGPSGFGSYATGEQVTEGIDASNLTIIITGGAAGLGFETARVLALRNAHVIIAARNMEAANDAKHKILNHNENARVDAMKLDLSSVNSVKEFAERFYDLDLPLNILINNAATFGPFQLSEDGVELQFATNHIGHFYLTNLLLDKMKETAESTGIQGRIVNVTSLGYLYTYPDAINFDKINDKRSYTELKAYGQSKLANILHANELSRRLQAEGANITVNSLHPGLIMTNIIRHFTIVKGALKLLWLVLGKDVPRGAATTCYVALHPQLKDVTAKFFEDCNERNSDKAAEDEDMAKKLWDFSTKLVDSALAKNSGTPL